MKSMYPIILFFCLLGLFGQEIQHHEFVIDLFPDEGIIRVIDTMQYVLSSTSQTKSFTFRLNRDLTLKFPERIAPEKEETMDTNEPCINGNLRENIAWNAYSISMSSSSVQNIPMTHKIEYEGKLCYDLKQSEEEYARSFSETPGIISKQGVYLSGATGWYPIAQEKIYTFSATVNIPENWGIVMPGKEISNICQNGRRIVVWESKPVEEIYLVASAWNIYQRQFPNLLAVVALREKEPSLANQYIMATYQYVSMYNKLLGEYPYDRFTLIENFWETGYGMPGFTLLGPKVIRFPFILQSSYPHEILHNWWGNGVFVDYAKGNWCEGLTAYLADHLMKEIAGQAAEYRRQTLQRYRDFVRDNQDFPLSEFRFRHSPTTEAVGYGKSLMIFHELRLRLGNDVFQKVLQEFYRRFLFYHASWEDFATVAESVSRQRLTRFFNERIHSVGAPEISVSNVRVNKIKPDCYMLLFTISQTQNPPWQTYVPIVVTMEKSVFQFRVLLEEKEKTVVIPMPEALCRLDIDPEFDVLRRLHRNEIPSSIGQIMGSSQVQLIISNTEELQQNFQGIARWNTNTKVISNPETTELASKESMWICGTQHALTPALRNLFSLRQIQWKEDAICIEGTWYDLQNHWIILTSEQPDNPELAIGWILGHNKNSIDSVLRKLPHYGKYSYLVFRGDFAENVLKGQWPIWQSPLCYTFQVVPMGILPKREPLCTLPETKLIRHVEYLADESKQGRGIGSKEILECANYIRQEFTKAGLRVLPPQTWEENLLEGKVTLQNIIGIIPGTDPKFDNAPVYIGAHYDHLGCGEFYAKEGYKGKIHPGANDNASGVAILLELAHYFAQVPGRRPMYFIAFSGEERNLLGSKYYVSQLSDDFKKNAIAMIALDTVGIITEKNVLILGSNTCREWPFIFQGCSYTTGVSISCTPSLDSSDNISFQSVGIPSVQIFTGPTPTYHTPNDTIGNISEKDMLQVYRLTQEAIQYLANRAEPLTKTMSSPSTMSPSSLSTHPTQENNRPSLGIMPSFEYKSNGVQIAQVLPNSNASKVGLQKGDIIISLQKENTADLAMYTKILYKYRPGDSISVRYLRQNKEYEVDIILQKR